MSLNKTNSILADLIQNRRFSEAKSLLGKIGVSISKDERVKIKEPYTDKLPDRYIFICGLHRSGTTIAHDYLIKNYNAFGVTGAKVPENEGQFLQDVYPLERPYGGPGSFAFYRQMQFDPIDDESKARDIRTKLLTRWMAWSTGPSEAIVEKSPPNIVRISYLRSVFPGAKFIIWIRDPRAVSLATRKWHPMPLHSLMMHWNVAHMKALNDLADDCLIVKYEEFCKEPELCLNQIASFCKLERRSDSPSVQGRFKNISDKNGQYIELFPQKFSFRAEVKSWEIFGYDLDTAGNV